ncbi:hypothetical protein [Sporolactobacillus shoreae]|nr:hypothetical protein [Sporolactobacillus shoreae]
MHALIPIVIALSLLLSHSDSVLADEKQQPLQDQIMSFMYGLETNDPKQAVDLWILGINNRSGAVQYAMLSPLLQEETKKQFEQLRWTTGQSSPWVDDLQVVKTAKISDTKIQFTLEYNLQSSYRNFGKYKKVITVERSTEEEMNWFITEIESQYNQWEAFTPAETTIK